LRCPIQGGGQRLHGRSNPLPVCTGEEFPGGGNGFDSAVIVVESDLPSRFRTVRIVQLDDFRVPGEVDVFLASRIHDGEVVSTDILEVPMRFELLRVVPQFRGRPIVNGSVVHMQIFAGPKLGLKGV